MKRPWQIWLLFALSLAVVVPAVGWLTVNVLELDRAEAVARAQIELEQDVNSVMWTMDAEILTPLMAREVARPYSAYQPFYTLPAETNRQIDEPRVASPLLTQPSPYILLHFQLNADGTLTSPQAPEPECSAWAVENGTSVENIDISKGRVSLLRGSLDYEQILARLPEATISTGNPVGFQSPMPSNRAFLAEDPLVANGIDLSANGGQRSSPIAGKPAGNLSPATSQDSVPGAFGGGDGSKLRGRKGQRGGKEFNSRRQALQNYAQQQLAQQRRQLPKPAQPNRVTEGASLPFWVKGQLLLARRVKIADAVLIQGAWLDWQQLRAVLVATISDVLPDADLVPLRPADGPEPGRTLATIPVQLVVSDPSAVGPGLFSPIRVSLMIAWACLLLATCAVAALLMGVINLSERRGAFVSAVTHELRTPLTTFRMYAEMLADGMLSDPAQRQKYLQTLCVEADRLWHLVENVLAYAQLERGNRNGRHEVLTVHQLLVRVQPRLEDRARLSQMKLEIDVGEAVGGQMVRTDPSAAEQILFNLVDNACKYATMADDSRIHIDTRLCETRVDFSVKDHGPGISDKASRQLFRPFSKSVDDAAHSAPGVGLGLALSERLARKIGGTLRLEKSGDGGACFVLRLPVAV